MIEFLEQDEQATYVTFKELEQELIERIAREGFAQAAAEGR